MKNNLRKAIEIDENLFSQISKGDMKAFEELYKITDRAVFSFILSILRNMQDAEDVMQDTYLRIRAASHLYKPQGKPLAWIFTIARNLSLMKLRTNKKSSFLSYDDLANKIDYSESMDKDNKIVLEAAFTILKEDERQIIIMQAVTGLRHREIAQIMDMPLSTVLSKYSRGLKKLKNHLIEKE